MKKLVAILILFFIVLFIIGIYCQIRTEEVVDIKTVPNFQYSEHLGLFWILNNEKIVKPNKEMCDIGNDYYN